MESSSAFFLLVLALVFVLFYSDLVRKSTLQKTGHF